jgi:hypothetical protein
LVKKTEGILGVQQTLWPGVEVRTLVGNTRLHTPPFFFLNLFGSDAPFVPWHTQPRFRSPLYSQLMIKFNTYFPSFTSVTGKEIESVRGK